MSRVGDNIRKVREDAGLTTKALSKKMGLAESYIIDVESGRKVVNEETIVRFSKVLGKNISELGLDSPETAVFKEEKEALRQTRVKAPPKAAETPLRPAVKNELWDQAFGSNLKNVPVYTAGFDRPAGQRLYPVEQGKVNGIAAEKAVIVRQDKDDLAGYGIYKGSLLLGQPVKDITQNGFYLLSVKGENRIYKVRLPGNANVMLFTKAEREISQALPLKDVKPLVLFVRVETELL